mgnify:CR=1 FL=1
MTVTLCIGFLHPALRPGQAVHLAPADGVEVPETFAERHPRPLRVAGIRLLEIPPGDRVLRPGPPIQLRKAVNQRLPNGCAETGTLRLEAIPADGSAKWQVEFDVRP